jgi:hypothetical protein
MCPDSDVDAMLACGQPRTELRTKASELLANIADLVQHLGRCGS